MESSRSSYSKSQRLFKLLFLLTIFDHITAKVSSAAATPPPPLLPKEALPTLTGYVTVNRTTGSSIFYAFYEAQEPNNTSISETPLLVWLQGGPGCSSMIGNLYELGSWRVSSSFRRNVEQVVLEPNLGPWNRIFGVVFIDNPIGTGFSIAASRNEIPRNQYEVAKHLWVAIREFLYLDSSFKTRPVYITGESYAGKYVPSFGYYVLKRNAQLPKSKQLNLHGVAIGNGLTDPATQVATHAVNAYYVGLVNEKQRRELEIIEEEAVGLTERGKWSEATDARTKVLNTLQNMTGLATLYDYRRLIPYQTSLVAEFLNNVEVKRAIGANVTIRFCECSDVVSDALHEDVMKSVKYMVEFLVRNTKVLLYQGANDLRDGVVSTEAWMKTMKWEGIGKFSYADRKVWRVNSKLAGYVQKWDSLTHVVVSNAGHLVPADQALNSQAMIEGWVLEKGLFAEDHQSAHNYKAAL